MYIYIYYISGSADDAAVNHNGVKTLLANDLIKFFTKNKPASSNGPRRLPKDARECTIFDSRFFDSLILTDDLFAKALQSRETWLSVNISLWEKLFSCLESPITFDERFKITSVPIFISNFNLLSYELDSFTSRLLYCVILYWYYIKGKYIHNIFTVPCEKSKMVSLASPVMNKIVVFPSRYRFPVRLICCIYFGSASSTFCLLKPITIIS